jgi:peptide/nickel transport system ATP-binding protein
MMATEDMAAARPNGATLLDVQHLKMYFPIHRGFMQRVVGHVRAVDDVSFYIREGETLGLVGESGCGKTTTGRCIVRAYSPTGGQIHYRRPDGQMVDLAAIDDPRELEPYYRQIRLIFQDPYSSLNPRMTLLQIVGEPLVINKIASGAELQDRVAALLRQVGLRPEFMRRYPHAFSGGQRQRIGIARALALEPRLLVCDEAVSALDVSVRAQILNLLQDLQEEYHLTYLFVAHDLSVVEHVADAVAVMYVGKLVEMAETEELYTNPKHPYTEALLSAVPKSDPDLRGLGQRVMLEGDVANPARPPSGCYFHPRCRFAQSICSAETPVLRDVGGAHYVACHLADRLSLRGVVAEGIVR